MTLALPGSRGLFSTLQEAFRTTDMQHRLHLGQATHDFLDDFRWLATTLAQQPTQMCEITPQPPTYIGSCDASGLGMGGVWFHPDITQPALLWRTPFAEDICQSLVSANNRTGMLTNSDLELLGAIAHQVVLAATNHIAESTNAVLNNNTAAIYWLCRGSVTSSKAAAYLLHLQALHSHHHCYITTYDHIPGPANSMANDCSHLWHLTDDALLTHFNSHYPQAASWTLCQLPSAMNSMLISALWQQQLVLELYLPKLSLLTATVHSGPPSATTSRWTPTLPTLNLNPSTFSVSLPSATAMEASHPMANQSSLTQWRTSSAWWARCWPYWGPRIPGSLL